MFSTLSSLGEDGTMKKCNDHQLKYGQSNVMRIHAAKKDRESKIDP